MSPNKPLKLPLAAAEVDRSAHLRSDEAYLQSSWPNALVLQFNSEKFASQSNQLTFVKGASLGEYDSQIDYFLGVKDGENFFLRHLNDETLTSEFKSLRAIGSFLSPRDIGLAVHAQGLANWHSKHPRCSLCGGPTVVVLAGAVRRCPADQSEHYPRTDSAIIVLIKNDKDQILLGRQKVWPKYRFSTFAGFVEPGESFEHCVIREVREEAGVELTKINYLGSQPWPFPASLMIAFEAITNTPELARPDGDEIEEIRWFSREEMKSAILDKSLILPFEISVARQMINAWYGDGSDKDLVGNQSW
ncbi:MAG: NAD(+) diphosphatase [Actinobacteria bacterium]|uniref:NAD(+) diphosphatase n=1 Tax=freshwater metagenome TaxID=449393 RepID=A0A6J6BN28_9ZZZZ|nr:NAD(+) diphosphatase [Actinomycetota bacterium]